MCGRFALHATEEEITAHFKLRRGFSMRSRFNIAPTQVIPIICDWKKQVEFARWGLVPTWAPAEEKIPPGFINARIETLHEKPAFKKAFRSQRCLIPASGYYEWRTIAGKKQPFYISLKNTPVVAFAGLWVFWQAQNGEQIRTCAIITAPAKPFLEKLHERMPVILSSNHYDFWVSSQECNLPLESLMLEIDEPSVSISAVTPRMGRTEFEGVECITPL